jgi:hypothetical protein
MQSSMKWRAGLLRAADRGRDRVAGGSWRVARYARHVIQLAEEPWRVDLGVMRRAN